jgi:hypothetical protein
LKRRKIERRVREEKGRVIILERGMDRRKVEERGKDVVRRKVT